MEKHLFRFSLLALSACMLVGLQQPLSASKHSRKEEMGKTHHNEKKKSQKFLCSFLQNHKNKQTKKGIKQESVEHFKHKIQLQLSDSLGFPVPNTQFWVTLNIVKEGPKVTIQLPFINFQTGQTAQSALEMFPPPFVIPGGYLYTADGFLPEEVRPNDWIPQSIVAASNNGLASPFSFTESPANLPVPPTGYIVQITNAGAIVVQCAGTFGNIIPPGLQTLMPCSITYVIKEKRNLCKNVAISTGATDVTQFTDIRALNDEVRDTHVNDAYKGVVAWAWCDNSMVADKTNGTLNCMVAIGKIDKHGKLKVRKPIQLTDLGPNLETWDTAVTINRTNPDNIIVSYGSLDHTVHPTQGFAYRAVSFDGGKTWPYNGILPTAPQFGDCRGVASDKFGNIWYGITNGSDPTTPPQFFVSVNGGIDFTFLYATPPVPNPNTQGYDFPQYAFGNDQNGNYGIWFSSSIANFVTGDGYPVMGFIPINGPGLENINVSGSSFTSLQELTNFNPAIDITASEDGRVWVVQNVAPSANGGPFPNPFTYINTFGVIFKSPGSINQNYAGPWNVSISNNLNLEYFGPTFGIPNPPPVTNTKSLPLIGYFNSVHTVLFDEKRKALYVLLKGQIPDYSQNIRISLIISRDNGMTWSEPIDISNKKFANRGFQTMALDEATGDLVFGWYDGRKDPTFKTIEYFGAVLPAKKLDKLVNKIPLSNPTFIVPSAAASVR